MTTPLDLPANYLRPSHVTVTNPIIMHDDLKPLHCARCHDTYTQNTNTRTSCIVPHTFQLFLDNGEEKICSKKCCGGFAAKFKKDDLDRWTLLPVPGTDKVDICHFQGYHTNDPSSVDYTEGYTWPCFQIPFIRNGAQCHRKPFRTKVLIFPLPQEPLATEASPESVSSNEEPREPRDLASTGRASRARVERAKRRKEMLDGVANHNCRQTGTPTRTLGRRSKSVPVQVE